MRFLDAAAVDAALDDVALLEGLEAGLPLVEGLLEVFDLFGLGHGRLIGGGGGPNGGVLRLLAIHDGGRYLLSRARLRGRRTPKAPAC